MEFKKGDLVEVRDEDVQEWHQAEYLIFDDGHQYPYVARRTKSGLATGFKQCRRARPDLNVDHKVWVRYKNDSNHPVLWKPRHFSKWDIDGRIRCWSGGRTEHSKNQFGDIAWDEYTLTDPKEEPCEK